MTWLLADCPRGKKIGAERSAPISASDNGLGAAASRLPLKWSAEPCTRSTAAAVRTSTMEPQSTLGIDDAVELGIEVRRLFVELLLGDVPSVKLCLEIGGDLLLERCLKVGCAHAVRLGDLRQRLA